jgi:hypothetical protein
LICLTECPYLVECMAAGMDEEYGVWGSLEPKEREALRRGERIRIKQVKTLKSPTRDFVVDQFMAGNTPAKIGVLLGTRREHVRDHLLDEITLISRDLGVVRDRNYSRHQRVA